MVRRKHFGMLLACIGFALGVRAWHDHVSAVVLPTDNALAHDSLPFYTRADWRPRWDEHMARPISVTALHDQLEQAVEDRWFEHRPTVVNFFFSGCTSSCPATMEMLKVLHKRLGDKAPQILSLSVTPATDTPMNLRAYATRFGLPVDWRLATGEVSAVQQFARDSLLTNIDKPLPDGSPPHIERALLLDRMRRIRGVYDITQFTELIRLGNDYARLGM